MHLHLDFETACDLNLKKVGGDVYARHPSARVLLTGWAIDHHAVQVAEGFPPEVAVLLSRPDVLVHAFNARFERLILWYVLKLRVPVERFRCTMVKAYYHSFSGGLAEVGRQVELPPAQLKQADGTRLMNLFCAPPYADPAKKPAEWERFKAYCGQDVESERAIEMRLHPYPMPDYEWRRYAYDQRVNDRGWPMDHTLVRGAIEVKNKERDSLRHQMVTLTGRESPDSTAQLRGWLKYNGLDLPDMQKATVADALKIEGLPSKVRGVLEIRRQYARATPKKWDAAERATCWNGDGTGLLRGALQFAGAGRTRRFSGRVLQPHNLARPTPGVPLDLLAEVLSTGDHALTRMVFGADVMSRLVDAIRSSVRAPEGRRLVVCDFASIESVLLAVVSRSRIMLDTFRQGRDTYKVFAANLLRKDYDAITKDERNWCKPPVLGCGYQLSGPGLVDYAAGMGVELNVNTASEMVEAYRSELYPEVPRMWYDLSDACMAVTLGHVRVWRGYYVTIYRDAEFLYIRLPSGHLIHYFKPTIRTNKWGRESFAYMGSNQYKGGKWECITTHGGKITENIIQAIAYDLLAEALDQLDLLAVNPCLVEVFGHVHDEICATASTEVAEAGLALMQRVMSTAPEWMPELHGVLKAEGYTAERYRK